MFANIFSSSNQRLISKIKKKYVDNINSLEADYSKFSDEELSGKTEKFRARLKEKNTTADSILIEAFATVKEAIKRTLGIRLFDVQLIGGVVLYNNMVAEMMTGEGKTLVATLPAYLNALDNKSVHIVTVNEYLVQRDAQWMGKIYSFLKIKTGIVIPNMPAEEKKKSYSCDIIYGTNNEFAFDYLRDNLATDPQEILQKSHDFAIIDEVDSILIDEARTPLIISGPSETDTKIYSLANSLIAPLQAESFSVDEKQKTVSLTDLGQEKMSEILVKNNVMQPSESLYELKHLNLLNAINQALKAKNLFLKGKDYIIKNNEVLIVDEFTGRVLEGRRYSDGLHQAIEAKEHQKIQVENQTLTSISFQNYFRMYKKLSGMTGTAITEAEEFEEIYDLTVVRIPTNKPLIRNDKNDLIYKSNEERDDAVVEKIAQCVRKKQPILVGTTTVEKSEILSKKLKKLSIKHSVLNAIYHNEEAAIIANAGKPAAVTLATNMAGRGTDIQLGGSLEIEIKRKTADISDENKIAQIKRDIEAKFNNDKEIVLNAGGLKVVGTQRHESRRIDNQLRGRSGRQGDPGETQFLVSLDDDLMRIFGSNRVKGMLSKLGLKQGEAIEHKWITKAIQRAQKKIENHNFEIRKQLLKYDDVVNFQRQAIFNLRSQIIQSKDSNHIIHNMLIDVLDVMNIKSIKKETELKKIIFDAFNIALESHADNIDNFIVTEYEKLINSKKTDVGEEIWLYSCRNIMLHTVDFLWKEHMLMLDHLRNATNFRSYAQKDPLSEYKQESFKSFNLMMANINEMIIQYIAHMEISAQEEAHKISLANNNNQETNSNLIAPLAKNTNTKIRRNDPCPCGSGKKYKNCHGKYN